MSSSDSASRSGSRRDFVPPSVEDLEAVLSAYEFIEVLGRGGMGAVYKARQPNLDRLVAIKILPAELGDEGLQFAERFRREAQTMAKLNHPNIVSVHDFGQTSDGQLYIVMEYVEGADLQHFIKSGQLTPEHVLAWTPQICDALQYAHSRGVVHRDIKPANILIDAEGTIKVADFGLAKLTGEGIENSRLTMSNVAMGTPDYIAPEALEDDIEPDHRADIYAVGVMLYEMLTGTVPRGAWQAPSAKFPELDPRFDDLVIRAMSPERESRIQQADEIKQTLAEIQSGPMVVAGSTSGRVKLVTGAPSGAVAARSSTSGAVSGASSRSQVQARRRKSAEVPKNQSSPLKAIATTIAVAALGIGGVFYFLRDRDPQEQEPTTVAAVDDATDNTDSTVDAQPPTPDSVEPEPDSVPPTTEVVASTASPDTAEPEPSPAEPEAADTPVPATPPEPPVTPVPSTEPFTHPLPAGKLVVIPLSDEEPARTGGLFGRVPGGLPPIVDVSFNEGYGGLPPIGWALDHQGKLIGWDYPEVHLAQWQIPDHGPLLAVDGGGAYTSVLTADGRLHGWGPNASNGRIHPPQDVANAVQISSSINASVARLADGGLRVWGKVDGGQYDMPAGMETIVDASASRYHNVALRADGRVLAWGANNYQQADVPANLGPATHVEAIDHESVALGQDGRLTHWGYNAVRYQPLFDSLPPLAAISTPESYSPVIAGHRCDGRWLLIRRGDPPGLVEVPAEVAGLVHGSLRLYPRPEHLLAIVPDDLLLAEAGALTATPGAGRMLTAGENEIDVLPRFDLEQDATGGDWQQDGTTIHSPATAVGTEPALLTLPVDLRGDYQLRLGIVPRSTDGTIELILPLRGGQVALELAMLSADEARIGLGRIDDQIAADSATATTVAIALDAAQALEVEVQWDAVNTAITVQFNGVQVIDWEGAPTRLTLEEARRTTPLLAAALRLEGQAQADLSACRLTMLTGDAFLHHGAPGRWYQPLAPACQLLFEVEDADWLQSLASDAEKAIAAAKAAHRKLYRENVGTPHREAVSTLNDQLHKAIERSIANQAAGDAELALALRADARTIANGEALPATDTDDTPALVGRLRDTWRQQLTQLEADRDRKADVVLRAFDQALAESAAGFTRQGKPDTAAAIQDYRQKLR